jgi:CheY-like chemotaxis protein
MGGRGVLAEGTVDHGGACGATDAKVPFRVLHIADDPAMADMYALGLEMHGFDVLKAEGGVAGLIAAATNRPDVVVIDIEVSVPDGPDVAALLRQDPKTVALPVILLTSYAPSEYREGAARLGVDEVLLKSETTPSKLGEAILRHLGRLHEPIVDMSLWESDGNVPQPLRRSAAMDETVKVLVIEDDPSVAEMYRLRLEGDGYEVVVGCDGEEGLQLAVDENPDFIYLDLRLPKLDGFEVLERLRAEPATAQIPVIILSNYGDPEMRERGIRLGALEFLVKADTTPQQLAAKVALTTGTMGA